MVGCQVPAVRSGLPVSHNLPPAQMLHEPGPGVGGPGPGVIAAMSPGGPMGGGMGYAGPAYGTPAQSSVQILFDKPVRMYVNWDVSQVGAFDSAPLVVPGRQNFQQGGLYRLKLTNIGGREGIELYPTLEVAPGSPRTAAYLAHAAIPIQFTEEDFDQVLAGNFVTKVIYVPAPEFQELALAGIDTLVSTRLDPGVDPIVEADRRGSILAIIRMGNKDLGLPGAYQGDTAMAGFGGAGGYINPSQYISGVSGPSYGMPYTGTSIGLPGPPHVPLGGPAGLQHYGIHNHTAHAIPGPTPNVNVHVKQKPGLTYPRPADTILVREHTIRPPHSNQQPPADMVHGNVPHNCPDCGGFGCRRCR
ncbi:MAG TPA: hypothetical protein PKD64_15895 [Pirellulaceae bacterium]|nr:hypothetical protein [Pirellulaceae bacterium]HMO93670.1 hypothetical protein [Pirellulaceae bacterium]HMP68412.1 hypothetical protein [Pirellulaceae bacterium]